VSWKKDSFEQRKQKFKLISSCNDVGYFFATRPPTSLIKTKHPNAVNCEVQQQCQWFVKSGLQFPQQLWQAYRTVQLLWFSSFGIKFFSSELSEDLGKPEESSSDRLSRYPAISLTEKET
jgi:hypothetical protein